MGSGLRSDDATAAPAPVGPVAAREQPGRVFADLLFVAATTCHAPFALISVAQPDGRWSTLTHGVERRDLLADDRLFAVVGRAAEAVEISDLTLNTDLASGPMARGPLGVRSMYGIPLRNRQSVLLGVLCVLDRRVRELSARERQALTAVARQVAGQLAMWRRSGSAPLSPAAPGLSGGAAGGGGGGRSASNGPVGWTARNWLPPPWRRTVPASTSTGKAATSCCAATRWRCCST